MPVSRALKTLDPGMRQEDDKGINQRLFKYFFFFYPGVFLNHG